MDRWTSAQTKPFFLKWLLVSVCPQQGETVRMWSISARVHGLAPVYGSPGVLHDSIFPGFPRCFSVLAAFAARGSCIVQQLPLLPF